MQSTIRRTLDKYIGDAIVTMFGMPIPVEDHAWPAGGFECRSIMPSAGGRAQWADGPRLLGCVTGSV